MINEETLFNVNVDFINANIDVWFKPDRNSMLRSKSTL